MRLIETVAPCNKTKLRTTVLSGITETGQIGIPVFGDMDLAGNGEGNVGLKLKFCASMNRCFRFFIYDILMYKINLDVIHQIRKYYDPRIPRAK